MAITLSEMNVLYREKMLAGITEHPYDTSFCFDGLIDPSCFEYDSSIKEVSKLYQTGLVYEQMDELEAPTVQRSDYSKRYCSVLFHKNSLRYSKPELERTTVSIISNEMRQAMWARSRVLSTSTMKFIEGPVTINTAKYVSSGGNKTDINAATDGVHVMPTPANTVIGLKYENLCDAITEHADRNPNSNKPNYMLMTRYEISSLRKDIVSLGAGANNVITEAQIAGMVGTTKKVHEFDGYLINTVAKYEAGSPLSFLEYGYTTPVIENVSGVYHLIRRIPLLSSDAMHCLLGYSENRMEEEAGNIGVIRSLSMFSYGGMRVAGQKVVILPVRHIIDPNQIPFALVSRPDTKLEGFDSKETREIKSKIPEAASRIEALTGRTTGATGAV